MSDQSSQNRYRLFGDYMKCSILEVMLLAFILTATSGAIGGASSVRAQTKSNLLPFQSQLQENYYYPVYQELSLFIDTRMIIVNGLPPPYSGLPYPTLLSELPQNRWVRVRTPRGEPLPVRVICGSCNLMRGCNVAVQWRA